MSKDAKAEKWLESKRKKHKFWQVKNFLKNLRLKFKELNTTSDNYRIDVPLFGLRFRFNNVGESIDNGWKVFFMDAKRLEREQDYFYEDTIFYLVSRGYFSYIREFPDSGKRIFNSILVDSGWGQKIMEKRIELCGDKPQYRFIKARTEEFLKLNILKVLSWYPSFFDNLLLGEIE